MAEVEGYDTFQYMCNQLLTSIDLPLNKLIIYGGPKILEITTCQLSTMRFGDLLIFEYDVFTCTSTFSDDAANETADPYKDTRCVDNVMTYGEESYEMPDTELSDDEMKWSLQQNNLSVKVEYSKPNIVANVVDEFQGQDTEPSGVIQHQGSIGTCGIQTANKESGSKSVTGFPHQCLICERGFLTDTGLHNHLLSHIFGEKGSLCSICQQDFVNYIRLIKHYKMEHNIVTCEECGASYTPDDKDKIFSMSDHIKNVCPVVHSQCVESPVLRTLSTRKIHEVLQEKIPTVMPRVCKVCNKKCRSRQALRYHIRKAHENELLVTEAGDSRCVTCKKVYSVDEIKSHGCTAYGWYPCGKCDVRFVRFDSRRVHLYKVHGEQFKPTEKCHNCGKMLPSSRSLTLHMKFCDGKEKVKLFPCQWCGKLYGRKYISHHVGLCHMNTAERNVTCKECGKIFTTQKYLRCHVSQVHAVGRKFICQMCGKSFKRMHHLDNHMASIHSDVKNFKCSYCPQAFKLNMHLLAHERTHTGETPLKCKICDRGFKDYAVLISHRRKEHGVR